VSDAVAALATPRRLPAWPAAAAAVALTLLTWQTTSLVATAGLDPSWRVALHLAHTRGIDFGPGFVWTYGPLGYLAFPLAVTGGTLAAALAFVLATQAALAYLLLSRGARAFGVLAAVVGTYAILVLPIPPADFLPLAVLALALWALDEPASAVGGSLPVLGGALAGVALLVKTNMGAAAVAVVVVAAAAGGVRRAAAACATVAAVFVALWLALGNALGDVPQWLRLSLSLVSGYSSAMQLEHQGLGRDYWNAALVALVLAVAVALAGAARGRARGAATVLVVAGFGFASFKESFVRHDADHMPAFFASAAVVLVALGARGVARWLVAAGVAAAVIAVSLTTDLELHPWSSAGHALAQVRDVVDSSRRDALVAGSRAGERHSYELPARVVRSLRGHTVHVDPWEAAAVNAYGLAWRPLPVLQSYSAYTGTLDERNADVLASGDAPERILRQDLTTTVNQRGRETEAPATFRAMLCDYRQVLVAGRWQVLAHAPRCGAARTIATVPAAAGEPVTVPDARADELVYVRLHLGDTLGNRLRGLLYKPHDPVVSLGGGPFRSIPEGVAEDGIVVHVPGNVGFDPRYGGAIDWRTVAAGGLSGGIRLEFDAVRVRGSAPPPRGERPPSPLPRYVLENRAGKELVVTPAGRALPVEQGGGFVDYGYLRGASLVLQGWAADAPAGVPASTVLVFADGRLVFAGPPNARRPDVAAALGHPALRRAGYVVLVPESEVRNHGARRDVRIIALARGRALEVLYPFSYGWRRR